jgi:WD40 repeat protein
MCAQWRISERTQLPAVQGHTGAVWRVALSEDGRIAAGGGWDTMIRLWVVPSGRLPATLQGHTGAVWGAALSKDGRLPAGGSYDGTAKLWETNSGAYLRTLLDDRLYERMDITGLSGVTEARRAALLALGAIEQASPACLPTPANPAHSMCMPVPPAAMAPVPAPPSSAIQGTG